MVARSIWGIKQDKLPKAKFDELMSVLREGLIKQYGPYTVSGMPSASGGCFVITMDSRVLNSSYKKSPCSLDKCMVTDAAFRCSRCKEAMYCSTSHQIADWKRHKVECTPKK